MPPPPPTIKVLDLGCGGGANTWYLAKEGFDTYAVDGSKTAVEKAKKLLDGMNLTATYAVGDVASLPYDTGFFDVVIDSAVIYANTLPGIKVIFEECYRVLKQGGMIFSTGNFSSQTTGYGTGIKIEEDTYKDVEIGPLCGRGTVHYFTREELLCLYSRMNNIIIDYSTRTDRENMVAYYMIQARK